MSASNLTILIAGPQYAGKSEVCARIKKRLTRLGIAKGLVAHTPIAKGLKDIFCAYKGIPLTSLAGNKALYRKELQALGDDLRKVRPDMLTTMALRNGFSLPIRIIDDVRYQEEVDFFSQNPDSGTVLLIKMSADADTRRVRCETLHGAGSYSGEDHPTEQAEVTWKPPVVGIEIDNTHWNQSKLDAYIDEVWPAILTAIEGLPKQPVRERRGRPPKNSKIETPTENPPAVNVDLPPWVAGSKPSEVGPESMLPVPPKEDTAINPDVDKKVKEETDAALNALFNEKE